MDTTAAAAQAGVTVATIRGWCRAGAVAAVKRSGRWVIDGASLARRIAIGAMRARRTRPMTDQPMYQVTETEITHYGEPRTVFFVVRTDGTPAGYGPGRDRRPGKDPHFSREAAEFYCGFYNRTPAGYHVRLEHPRARSMQRTPYWLLTSTIDGDPRDLRMTLNADWTQEGTGWPEGTQQVDVLVKWVDDHCAGSAARIEEKAAADALAAAEAEVREARRAHLAGLAARKGPLATLPQVDYILQLLARREYSGEGGGFFYGPKDRAGIEEMSRGEASTYITSLKGDY